MATGLFLVKPQILEQRRLRTVVRLIEEESFRILDMCILQISASEFEAFVAKMNQRCEAIEISLYSEGRAALFAVAHREELILTRGSRIEQNAKIRFFPGDEAAETWFGKLIK